MVEGVLIGTNSRYMRASNICQREVKTGARKIKQHFKSNQIILIGLRSSKDYYKRPGGVAGVHGNVC